MYRMTDEECEAVTLNSLEEKLGVGTALLSAVKAHADQEGVRLGLYDDGRQRQCHSLL